MIKEKLLLHVCCAPCSLNVIEELKNDFDLYIYFYNPNIYPKEEYLLRKNVLINYITNLKFSFLEEEYNYSEFENFIKGYENEPEKGKRCQLCFYLRLFKTAEKAKLLGISTFATTLTISLYKKSQMVFDVANNIQKKLNIKFLEKDFKKNDGYKKTIEKAKTLNIYIQKYCGCFFSLR